MTEFQALTADSQVSAEIHLQGHEGHHQVAGVQPEFRLQGHRREARLEVLSVLCPLSQSSPPIYQLLSLSIPTASHCFLS